MKEIHLNYNELMQVINFLGLQYNREKNRYICPICGSKSVSIDKRKPNDVYCSCFKGCGSHLTFLKQFANNTTVANLVEEIINRKLENTNTVYIQKPYWYLPTFDLNKINRKLDRNKYLAFTYEVNEKNAREFIEDNIPLWVMKKFDVRYRYDNTHSQHQISIPTYDINGNLIGIHTRNYKKDLEKRYKYMPMFYNGDKLSIKSKYNLYGLNMTKDYIRQSKEVILFESQKAVMQSWGYGYKMGVGVYGCYINEEKIALLKKLGIKNFIFALDKEWENKREIALFMKKICKTAAIIKKNIVDAKIYLMEDFSLNDGILKLKQNPADAGRNIFWNMYNSKIELTNEEIGKHFKEYKN